MLEKLFLVGKFTPEGTGEGQGKESLIEVPFDEILLSLLMQTEATNSKEHQPKVMTNQSALPDVHPDEGNISLQKNQNSEQQPRNHLPISAEKIVEDKLNRQPLFNANLTGEEPKESSIIQKQKTEVSSSDKILDSKQLPLRSGPKPQKPLEFQISTIQPGQDNQKDPQEPNPIINQVVEKPKSDSISRQEATITKGLIKAQEKIGMQVPVKIPENVGSGPESGKEINGERTPFTEPQKFIDAEPVEERGGVDPFIKGRYQKSPTDNQTLDRFHQSTGPSPKRSAPTKSEPQNISSPHTINVPQESNQEGAQATEQVVRKEIPHSQVKGEVKSVNIKFEDTQLSFRFNTTHSNLSVEVKAKNALENYITFLDAGRLQKTLSMLGVGLESMKINGNELISRSVRTVRRDLKERDIIDRNEGISEKADSRPFNNSGLNLFL